MNLAILCVYGEDQNLQMQTFLMVQWQIHMIFTEQNYKRNTFVFAPIFHELNSKTFSMYTKGLFLSNSVHKSV